MELFGVNIKMWQMTLASILLISISSEIIGEESERLRIDKYSCREAKTKICRGTDDLVIIIDNLIKTHELNAKVIKNSPFYNFILDAENLPCNLSLFELANNLISYEEMTTFDRLNTADKLLSYLWKNDLKGTNEKSNSDLLETIKLHQALEFVYAGNWVRHQALNGEVAAQCFLAVDQLAKIFKLKRPKDITWRTAYSTDTVYAVDIINQKSKHSGFFSSFELETAFYWLERAKENSEYARLVWDSISEVGNGTRQKYFGDLIP